MAEGWGMLAYNLSLNEVVEVEAGFLVVKTFSRLYIEYRERYQLRRDVYAVPRVDREPAEAAIEYRGLDRDALEEYGNHSKTDTEIQLVLLEVDRRAVDGIVFSQDDARELHSLLGPLQADYEIIWSRLATSRARPPDGFSAIGFEATYFTGDHFSPSCDCMLFPRWHGTDEEGELFLPHFRQLNAHGLFATPAAAQEFLRYYRSFDWTEIDPEGGWGIAEVFIPAA
jgi:hypothetical protein